MIQLKHILIYFFLSVSFLVCGQEFKISGLVLDNGSPVPFVNVLISGTSLGAATNENGNFTINLSAEGKYTIIVSAVGYNKATKTIVITKNNPQYITINLIETSEQLEEMVVTGTLKAVIRSESPVPVEVYSLKTIVLWRWPK